MLGAMEGFGAEEEGTWEPWRDLEWRRRAGPSRSLRTFAWAEEGGMDQRGEVGWRDLSGAESQARGVLLCGRGRGRTEAGLDTQAWGPTCLSQHSVSVR